jgi:hypothetical protein
VAVEVGAATAEEAIPEGLEPQRVDAVSFSLKQGARQNPFNP